ncbi:semaphorin-4E-like isoform X2 [Tachysurus fulvidraco]|uniref:semaphorin-4E-like isoform X2 n=1 Tax=Tachysurus fulvidraco TaxID=1234273 RepID=UPI001FEE6F09|nr:semaphorin-4E-like isoform X2 [Tachysurus fulvidraco]XP_047662437.1 semaphorin-4E-like isoform X2 [Tachysurus fulvidraco]
MLFFLVLSFWVSAVLTSGQVWPLNSTPRKTVTLSNRGHVFQEEGVWNYTTMLLMEDEGVLILGAREAIFALDLNNITHKKAMVKWAVTSEMQRTCIFKGKTQTDCHNYIRILHKMSNDTMFVCGTNAFNPTCDIMSYKDGKLTLEGKQQDGKGKCPFDPFLRCASEFVDGKLYSATYNNFLGFEPIVMRSLNGTIRTEYKTSWLNEPNFIGIKHVAEGDDNPEGDDDKIYLFFNERAVEYDAYSKMEVSRVARVCKGDVGGQRTLQKKWTSFLKTHLDCPVLQTRLPLLIQDVFLFCPDTWKTCMFYGVFTPQGCELTKKDMSEYSAVCAYRIQDIREVFSKGKFKTLHDDTSLRKWVTYYGPLPDPRPGACINSKTREKGISKSLDLPDKTLMFIRDNPLMDQAVKPSEQPLLVKKGAAFTCIVVASTTALDGSSHQVMFIGTASGSVLKAVNYDGKMVIIEEVQLFKQSDPVKILRLSISLGQLYAGSEEATVQMPLSTCDHYASCMDCVLARDPYCGWDLSADRCIAIKNIHPDTHSEVVQSLRDGNAARCPAVKSTTIIKTFYPGNEVRLLCQPGSNLARVQWSLNNHTIQNSNTYHIQHNNLLILNALDRYAGFYTCTSVESSNGKDYVIQTATYELRLGNFMEHPSVQLQVQKLQNTLLALKILVIIPTLILLVLVVWNFYKGHFAVQRKSKKSEESPQSVSVCQEPLQIVQESSRKITFKKKK